MRPRGSAAPSREDPVVAGLSEVVGGPLGDHAGRHPWWTPVRVLLVLTALTFALGMLHKAPCYSDGWSGDRARYGYMCYSDLPYLYAGRGLSELAWPYDAATAERHQAMEYPVGVAYWAWGTAFVTHLLTGSPDLASRSALPAEEAAASDEVRRESLTFVAVNAVGLAVLALLATWLLAGVNPGRPWDAAGFAAAPVLALTGLINWDLLAVVLGAGALWAWARDRPVLTGILIGLGTAAKLYPLFLLGGLLVICWRERRWRELLLAAGAAAVAWAAVNLPAYAGSPAAWRAFWEFNADRAADLGSVWLGLSQLGAVVPTETINLITGAFFAAWCLGVLLLGLRAPATPRLAQLGFLIVLGFLLVNKVYSPQYVLWLLPLAALAHPRWRDLLIWQAAEVFYFGAVWLYLGGWLEAPLALESADSPIYLVAIGVRVAGQLWFAGMVTRDILHPTPSGQKLARE